MKKIVRLYVDPSSVGPGQFAIGGARIVQPDSDADLGRELRTIVITCHGQDEADQLRACVASEDGLEMESP